MMKNSIIAEFEANDNQEDENLKRLAEFYYILIQIKMELDKKVMAQCA